MTTRFAAPWAALVALTIAGAATRAPAQFMARANQGVNGESSGTIGFQSDISGDGRFVAFDSFDGMLVPGDTNGVEDIFVKDLATGAIEIVSLSSAGELANDNSFDVAISDDGNVVAFASRASNLVAGDLNGVADLFVRDRAAGTTLRVSLASDGSEATFDGQRPEISGDGNVVAWDTRAGLGGGDHDGDNFDIYTFNLRKGTLRRISLSAADGDANGDSIAPALGSDGKLVAFQSTASNLVVGDTNGGSDIFVRDVSAGATTRVSVDSAGHETVGGYSSDPRCSADGTVVAFVSNATNLVANDTNGDGDVFVHDAKSGATERVSLGDAGQENDNASYEPAISGDGGLVAFFTLSRILLAGGSQQQILLRDRAAGTTRLVSESALGRIANQEARVPAFSNDGRFVVFASSATNLIPRENYGGVYRRDLLAPPDWAATLDYGAGWPGTLGAPLLSTLGPPALGATFTLNATNSFGPWTLGILVTGLSQAAIPTGAGGLLLASPDLITVIAVPPWGFSGSGDLPFDENLTGIDLFEQVLELDPGAAGRLSFSAGVELHLGR